jgi:hypothetical protein
MNEINTLSDLSEEQMCKIKKFKKEIQTINNSLYYICDDDYQKLKDDLENDDFESSLKKINIQKEINILTKKYNDYLNEINIIIRSDLNGRELYIFLHKDGFKANCINSLSTIYCSECDCNYCFELQKKSVEKFFDTKINKYLDCNSNNNNKEILTFFR